MCTILSYSSFWSTIHSLDPDCQQDLSGSQRYTIDGQLQINQEIQEEEGDDRDSPSVFESNTSDEDGLDKYNERDEDLDIPTFMRRKK